LKRPSSPPFGISLAVFYHTRATAGLPGLPGRCVQTRSAHFFRTPRDWPRRKRIRLSSAKIRAFPAPAENAGRNLGGLMGIKGRSFRRPAHESQNDRSTKGRKSKVNLHGLASYGDRRSSSSQLRDPGPLDVINPYTPRPWPEMIAALRILGQGDFRGRSA
jgi:hypothetical protein